VRDVDRAEAHVTELVGLYYLDALGREENDTVERHLADCEECREEAARAVDAVAMLAFLSDEDRQELVDNYGALDRVGPPSERFVRFFAGDLETGALDSVLEPGQGTTDKSKTQSTPENPAHPVRGKLRRRFGRRKAAKEPATTEPQAGVETASSPPAPATDDTPSPATKLSAETPTRPAGAAPPPPPPPPRPPPPPPRV
jgi:hypothetical protein